MSSKGLWDWFLPLILLCSVRGQTGFCHPVRPWSTVPIQAQSSQPIVWKLKPAKWRQKESRSLSLLIILSIWDSFGKVANNGSLEMAGQCPLWALEKSWLPREEPTTARCKKWRVAGAKWASGDTQVKSKRTPWANLDCLFKDLTFKWMQWGYDLAQSSDTLIHFQ